MKYCSIEWMSPGARSTVGIKIHMTKAHRQHHGWFRPKLRWRWLDWGRYFDAIGNTVCGFSIVCCKILNRNENTMLLAYAHHPCYCNACGKVTLPMCSSTPLVGFLCRNKIPCSKHLKISAPHCQPHWLYGCNFIIHGVCRQHQSLTVILIR